MSKEYDNIKSKIRRIENSRNYKDVEVSKITDRINWAYKFKKISEEEMDDLVNDITSYMDGWLKIFSNDLTNRK